MDIVVDFRDLPTEDDEGSEVFYCQRHIPLDGAVVPCRWGLLDNAKTRQDVRDLVVSTLVGLQSLAAECFGGKFPYLFNTYGWPCREWDMNFSDGTVQGKLSTVAPICKLAMYFMRTFGRLRSRFGTSEAVNLVDGIVTGENGLVVVVGYLVKHLMEGDVTVADLNDHTFNAQRAILGEHELVLNHHVLLKRNQNLDANDLRLSEVVLTERPAIQMGSRPLKMLKLALQGYLWRTDHETSSILRAVCDKEPRIVGRWEPLTRSERGEMLDAIDADGHFRVVGTSVWVRRIWGRHTLVRREAFYERIQQKHAPSLGYTAMGSCEQDAITSRTVELLTWMRDRPQEWAEELFNDLYRLKSEGYNPVSEEVGRAIQSARIRAVVKHGGDDECFEMIFGPINTSYSFACESTDVSSFASLHYRRCLRVIGACSSVDGIPLYQLETSHQLNKRVESIVKDVTKLEPILNDLQGKPTPQLYKPWKTELMWEGSSVSPPD